MVNKNVTGHCLFVNYLSQQKFEKDYIVQSVSLRRRALRDRVNFTNFAFWIDVILMWLFNFTVLISCHAIRVFLV